MRVEPYPEEGEVLLVDKPAGWTSFDVVHRLRVAYGGVKMGHAGTLDPLATGLLILCTGRKRKEIDRFMGLETEYAAQMRLGIRTPSYDTETEVTSEADVSGLTEAQVREVLQGLVGTQQQIPPMWSAVKIGGQRLYTLARKGIEVDRPPREVQVHSIRTDRIAIPDVAFTVVCSKGTYIRTLIHDMGEKLGCGATMTGLRRTRIGPYNIEDALSVPQLVERAQALRLA
jgi:tRNA pseudouridine55 synthase